MLVVEFLVDFFFYFISGNTINYITIQIDSSHLIYQYLETVVKFPIFLNCILKMVSGNLTETSVACTSYCFCLSGYTYGTACFSVTAYSKPWRKQWK